MSAFIDLAGQKFGKLTVIRRVVGKYKSPFWYCMCDCGTEAVCNSSNLTRGHTKSCGCLQSEWCKTNFTTHGLRGHPLYRLWSGIHQRCYKTYSISYKNYGAKGVYVCKEWHDFMTFYKWALDNGWKRGLQIDKDIRAKELGLSPNLYSPERCLIVTVKTNTRARMATKLTIDQADEIRQSKEKRSVLMKRYGVGGGTIYNIKNGISWT